MSRAHDAERALQLAAEAYDPFDEHALIAHLSDAIRGFTAAEQPCRAAMASVQLGNVYANALGNLTAGRAWFARAARLVEHQPRCVEQGWVAVAAMGCDVDDPDELLARAELALDRARHFGDLNLETKALADAGLAHVQLGRVEQGMSLLDEAMALACGPSDDDDSAAKSVCSFFTACYHAADFARADGWSGLLRQRGLIGTTSPAPVILSSHCDSVQAALLVELGCWGDAETVLLRAKAGFELATGSSSSWHPDIGLADLRTRQGRYVEAEALLLDKATAIEALLPTARLHLARGDADLARTVAERGLRLVRGDRLRAAELLAVLVDAHLVLDDTDAAEMALQELDRRTGGLDVPALRARSAAAGARVRLAKGDGLQAVSELARAIDDLDPVRMPWSRATLLLALAHAHDGLGELRSAEQAATEAAAALSHLDVELRPRDAELLRRLAPGPRRRAATSATLSRDGAWWTVACDGASVRLRDTKGLRYLAELIAAPGAERHVLDLVDRVEGVAADRQLDRRALGDAGVVIDARARNAYRRRIEAVRAEIDDALAGDQLDAAEALQSELDALVTQLAGAFGLGGRSRVAASAAERARLNVTRSLRTAVNRLTEALPEPGAALDRGVRTGRYCSYQPSDGEMLWIVQTRVNEFAAR